MSEREIRLNPFTGEWIIYSPSRQKRPDREKQVSCPFCVGSEEVPSFSNPMRLLNKYSALSQKALISRYEKDFFHVKRGAYGRCEIVVYTAEHESKFTEMKKHEILEIFETWNTAVHEISQDKTIQYILPFENYGEAVGATIIHPHGQIYSFPFIPTVPKKELEAYENYALVNQNCMICDYITNEVVANERIVYQDQNIVALVPYHAQYAYDVYLYPKQHYGFLKDCPDSVLESFAELLPKLILSLFSVLEKEVSYSLSLHQKPVNYDTKTGYHIYFKLHTPQRNHKSLKLLGAVESSLGTFINGSIPEIAAKKLREALQV